MLHLAFLGFETNSVIINILSLSISCIMVFTSLSKG